MKLLHDLVVASAEARPEYVALYAGERRATYADLAHAVHGVANGLAQLGVMRGERVAIFLPNQKADKSGLHITASPTFAGLSWHAPLP